LSGNFSPDIHPICRDLGSTTFPVGNGFFVIVNWWRHSFEKGLRINFRCDEASVFRSALGEYAIDELALIELGSHEIAPIEGATLERDMTKENSSEHTTTKAAILKR
jgi:hypothetical protein